MKVCDESLYHEIAVIYRFLHLYERMETMEGEALDFITRDFDAWKRRREQRRQSEKKIKKEGENKKLNSKNELKTKQRKQIFDKSFFFKNVFASNKAKKTKTDESGKK